MPLLVVFIQRDVGGLDRELAAPGHSIGGVDRQIDQNLLELCRVHLDPTDVWCERHHEVDILDNQPFEHRFHAADERIDVQNRGLQDLPSAEGEELSRETGCSFACFFDLEEIGTLGSVRSQPCDQQFAEPEDGCQQIVEVVCDAAR